MIANEKGSTSVLVILVIIVLATFAGIAVTSSWINRKLAMKNVSWTEQYYEQDRLAEYKTARIDAVLLAAQEKALAYFTDGYFAQGKLPEGIAPSTVPENFLREADGARTGAQRVSAAETLFTRLYWYYAAEGLSRIAAREGLTIAGTNPAGILDPDTALPARGDLTVSFTQSSGDMPGDLRLHGVLDVLPPAISAELEDGDNWRFSVRFVPESGFSRFLIVRWNVSQVPMTVSGHTGSSFDGVVG
ncbi:MAG: hypothetical protein ACOX7W_00580 [Christensenellales bacterium]|jgi:hypothetical protein